MSVDITCNRIDRIYKPGVEQQDIHAHQLIPTLMYDTQTDEQRRDGLLHLFVQEKVTGAVVVTADSQLSHTGIKLQVEGLVTLTLSPRSIGLFEAFSSALKPITLLHAEIELSAGGRVPKGTTELPFEFTLKPAPNQTLCDTYHGVYVNIQYMMTATMLRGMMSRAVTKQREFLVETQSDPNNATNVTPSNDKPFHFKVSPESLQNVKEASKRKIPDFLFEGFLAHTTCNINQPFTGELSITRCAVDIKSIELQLVRVESCSYMDREAREATEIQNIQIAEGNIIRGLNLPIHMVFPRLFTCSTTVAKGFSVEFEVNLIILFADNHMVTENFPIKLYR